MNEFKTNELKLNKIQITTGLEVVQKFFTTGVENIAKMFNPLNINPLNIKHYRPLRVDSALRALSTLRGLRGAPEVPPLCRETQSLGQHMLDHFYLLCHVSSVLIQNHR